MGKDFCTKLPQYYYCSVPKNQSRDWYFEIGIIPIPGFWKNRDFASPIKIALIIFRTDIWQMKSLCFFFQVLELIGNPISQLPDEIFMKSNLVNLQEIVLSQCQVNVIERHAFKSLSNLMKLDLNHNQLSMVPSLAFHDITQLRELSLSFNPIEKVSLSLKWSYLPSFSAVFLNTCLYPWL